MYCDYWQLRQRPFENSHRSEFLFAHEAFQAVELKVRYVIENRLGAALLVGPSGCGKTFLTHTLLEKLPETIRPVIRLEYPYFSARELLSYVAAELGGEEPRPQAGADELVRSIEKTLRRLAQAGQHPVIIIEGAHLIEDVAAFHAMQLLIDLRGKVSHQLTLLILGEPALIPRLKRTGSFVERLALRGVLSPLNENETFDYIQHRLQVAGADRPLLDDDALAAVFRHSGGVPLQINHLCELALLVAFADSSQSVTAAQVEAVIDEIPGLNGGDAFLHAA